MPIAAAIQMTTGVEVEANLAEAGRLLREARDRGAELAVLPEYFPILARREAERVAVAEDDGKGPIQDWLAARARDLGMWIVGGTIPLKAAEGRMFGSCLVFDENGQRVARFDKMHLFDVEIPEKDEAYLESRYTAHGSDCAVVDSPLGRLGLAVCYDLRFPELFRAMSEQGAQTFAVPSAFTVSTGQAHWELLVRARAVDNLAAVIAAAQSGQHENGRETYGDSMIVDAWGRVLERLPEGPGVVVAEVDLEAQARTRERFPVLDHRRM